MHAGSPSADKKFEVFEKPLGNLLNLSNYKLLIPAYQRPYEWTQKEVQVLYNDLKNTCPGRQEQETPVRPASQYVLLGSMMLFQQSSGDQCQVVDGQQRLSTMVLVYSVLYHRLEQLRADAQTQDAFRSRFVKSSERILELHNALAGDHTETSEGSVRSWETLTNFCASTLDVNAICDMKQPDKYTLRWRDICRWVEVDFKTTADLEKFKNHLDNHVYINITLTSHLALALHNFVRSNSTGTYSCMMLDDA